jgi:predicted acetyltransferase
MKVTQQAGEARIERVRDGNSWFFRLFYNDEPVSRLWVHDLNVRFGEAIVRMGGIGGVWTEEAYRKRGFARRLLEAANDYMRDEGFDIASLFGISDFYERWGYVPAGPEYSLKVRVDNIKGAELKHRVVDFCEQHRLDVLRIYEHNNLHRICSVVRSPESWTGFVRGTDWFVEADVKVFLNERGEVVGYVSLDKVTERTAVAEVGFATPEVFESMVAFLAQRVSEYGHDEITLLLPPDHEFAIYLRRYGCVAIQEFHRSGGFMARIINLGSLMAKLSVELSRRVAKESRLSGCEKDFAIVTDIGEVLVRVKSGQVKVETEASGLVAERLKLPQGKLTQLLMGYQTIDTLIAAQDVRCSPDLIPLLRVLFPPAYPYIWWSDRF